MEAESPPLEVLNQWMRGRVAEILKCPPEDVDASSSFTSLGMDSLSLMTLTGDLADWLNCELEPAVLQECPTIASLSQYLARGESGSSAIVITRVSRDQPLPLTFSQARILAYSNRGPEGDGNLVCESYVLRGSLDLGALQATLNEVARMHEMLRTTFVSEGGQSLQVIHPPVPVEIQYKDLTGDTQAHRKASVLVDEFTSRRMDLRQGPLFQAMMITTGENNHRFVLLMHHSLCDARALAILHEDLTTLYAGFRDGSEPLLPEPALHVADFAAWQRDWLRKDGEPYQSRLKWWQEYWQAPLPSPMQLPYRWKAIPAIFPDPADCEYIGGLPEALVSKIKALGREEDATPYVGLLTAFAVLLSRLTGDDDLVIGTYVSDRTVPATKRMMGAFLSMLPLRIIVRREQSFRQMLRQTLASFKQAELRRELPFEDLSQSLRDAGRPVPEVRVIFQYVIDSMEDLKLAGLEVEHSKMARSKTMPWGFHVSVREESSTNVYVACDGTLYDPGGMKTMLKSFDSLLQAILDDPDQIIT